MQSYSINVSVPDIAPFDQEGNWFETLAGSVIEPVTKSGLLGRFWFTRYGAIAHGKNALFRFEANELQPIVDFIGPLLQKYGLGLAAQGTYDVSGDIGLGERSRFLGKNSKHAQPSIRGEIAFSFLHASACLFIDCLVGPDSTGRFSLEAETESGFSKESSLEQFHHLFCNMTGVPIHLVIGMPPGSTELVPLSYEEFKGVSGEPGWRFGAIRKATF